MKKNKHLIKSKPSVFIHSFALYRKPISARLPPLIYRASIGHLSRMYRKSIEDVSEIYRESTTDDRYVKALSCIFPGKRHTFAVKKAKKMQNPLIYKFIRQSDI